MTNFWDKLKNSVGLVWNVERGIKFKIGSTYALFMLLFALKHARAWEFLANMFRISPPTIWSCISLFLELVEPNFFEYCVTKVEKANPMRDLVEGDSAFTHHLFERYATDMTFQRTNRPMGNGQE